MYTISETMALSNVLDTVDLNIVLLTRCHRFFLKVIMLRRSSSWKLCFAEAPRSSDLYDCQNVLLGNSPHQKCSGALGYE